MPCCVVYQDTTESRTLETKRHATSGRLTAAWTDARRLQWHGHGSSLAG